MRRLLPALDYLVRYMLLQISHRFSSSKVFVVTLNKFHFAIHHASSLTIMLRETKRRVIERTFQLLATPSASSLNRDGCQNYQELESPTTKSWITTNLEHVWSEAVPRCLTNIERPTDEHAHLLMLYKYHKRNILIWMARLIHIPWASEQSRFFLNPLQVRAMPYIDFPT